MTDIYLHAMFGLGGGLGAVLRHWLALRVNHDLPLSTLIVNVLGSLLLGLWIGYLGGAVEMGDEEKRLVFGFCGGFTTFSSFAYQSLELRRERTIVVAVANIMVSLALCWIALWLGLTLTR
ncbi:fluoride efflux transporter CrcB [Rhodobacteraceae bacterium B1Z28]|uniref:Fluoride-specific ion channel FluC n=1 Tax=Ruegeria haliotis TaxID=2747601 RepID=A0ABX2PVR1_9RHOB|nr:fluoride efflux transporter CrcB [Ruegeria haliotis]NVO57755.1 fluoride efflux transporter CrcB [Ruegeria haliotis]